MEVHFIAIGGSVMHQLALSLSRKGYTVTGSDDEIFEPALTELKHQGLLPAQMGWFPEKIHTGLSAIILGMHARQDNPELIRARELNIPIYSFPEYIFNESKNKQRIVVGGSHGKTTTTAMIMHVLKASDKAFDYLVGARLKGFDYAVSITDAPLIVSEGDEYPASAIERRPKFHFLFRHIAIITGIAWDHINVFPTFEGYLEQFTIFIDKIEPGGVLIYNETDPVLKSLVDQHPRQDIIRKPYRIPVNNISNGKTNVSLGSASADLKIFGNHNLLNLHAAWYACELIGIKAEAFLQAISGFSGASKRLEILAENSNAIVFRDFAHAPSKLKATINAVKEQFPQRKLVAVFELHTYSSLNEKFLHEYAGSMDPATEAVVYFSPHALQIKKLPLLKENEIREGFKNDKLTVLQDPASLMNWLEARDYSNTTLLLMSSGTYDGADILTFARQKVQKTS